ncbi:unnamed protein product [Thelazia callipaeda]|uniref:FAS1 domain-containing protein n=1 Tax=Thelazia callipaeda TaxID=103827 RepID=A0A0N5CQZ4_THECL|nr:unnamed protein product [Thelazia callipaeda]
MNVKNISSNVYVGNTFRNHLCEHSYLSSVSKGPSKLVHSVIRNCSLISQRSQTACNKLRKCTVRKDVDLDKLPADPGSLAALALHIVPGTYMIASN